MFLKKAKKIISFNEIYFHYPLLDINQLSSNKQRKHFLYICTRRARFSLLERAQALAWFEPPARAWDLFRGEGVHSSPRVKRSHGGPSY